MSQFVVEFPVRFRHCDPAGIVFYPRYFEMLNDVVEDWFASLGWSFATLVSEHGLGVPMAGVEARFIAPSRLGEVLEARVTVERVGRSSCASVVEFSCGEQARVRFAATMVCASLDPLRSVAWPDGLRAALTSPLLRAAS